MQNANLQNGNQTLLRRPDGTWGLRFVEDGHRVEFVAADNPRRLFMTTEVAMYVDGMLWDSQDAWTCEYRFTLPASMASTRRKVVYGFGYNVGDSFSLRWKRFEDGRFRSGGALPISHAGTTSVCLGAVTLWAIVWYSWLVPKLCAWLGY